MDVVLYYKASNPDPDDLPNLPDLPKEEKKMEENREETEEEPKEEARDELVSEPPAPVEMKATEDAEEGFEESQDQEGKEEDNRDEEDNNPRPETSEENPLKISESRKVTTAKGWIVWEMGPWAQMPVFRVIQPRIDFYRSRGQ